MEIIIVIVGIILLAIDNSKGEKEKRQPVAFDTQTGLPIYDEKFIIKEYDSETGRPIYQNEYKIIGYKEEDGTPIYDKKAKVIGYDTQTGYPIFEGEEEKLNQVMPINVEEKKINKNRLSNTILMIVGAVLVIVASLIFLVSSWDSINSLLKTLILVAIQLIFALFSRICKKQLEIPKVSKVFNYIVLAFVPIVLLSLSCFEAIGDYFSISGDGWPYYFGTIFLFTDIFYKVYGKIKDDYILKRMSFIYEVLAILFITMVPIDAFEYVLIILISHSTIMYILLHGNYLDNKAYNIFNNVYTYILITITALLVIAGDSIICNLGMLIYTILFFLKYIKYGNPEEKMLNIILFLLCYASTLRIIDNIEVASYFIYLLAFIPIVLLTKTMKSETVKNATSIIVLFASLGIILSSLFNIDGTIFYLLTFVASFILYLIMYYIFKKPVYKSLVYISFAAIFLDICNMTQLEEISKYILIPIVILIYAFEYIFENLKDEGSFVTILGMLYLESLILVETYYVIIPFIMLFIYLKMEKRNENFLILPMVFNLSLLELDNDITANIISFLLLIIYSCMSFAKKKINIYSIFSLITLIGISLYYELSGIIFWCILLIWGFAHILINTKENNKFFKVVTLFSGLGIYITILADHLYLEYASLYLLGFYLTLIIMTKYLFANNESIGVLEIIGSIFIGLAGLIFIKEIADGIALIVIALVLCIVSFNQKWKEYFYCTLITMIVYIFILALRFWGMIPWYVYILFIGIALIIYAMYDEKKKIKIEQKETEKTEISEENKK